MLAHYDDNDSGLMELDEFARLCYRLGYRPETRGHGHGRGHERGYGHERGGYERGRGGGHDRALEQLSEALSREEGRVELRKLFRQLDTDGDGRLSSEEWARGMGKQGTAMAKYFGGSTYEDLARAFSRIDANGDGSLTCATHAHARTHARMHACTHARMHACTHTSAPTRARMHARTPRAPPTSRWEELVAAAADHRLQHKRDGGRSPSPRHHRDASPPRHRASSSGLDVALRGPNSPKRSSSGLEAALRGSTSPPRREGAGARPASGLDIALRGGSATADRPVAKAVPSRGGLDIALRS